MSLIKKMNGYEIWSSDRYGKACAGAKRTNGVQVRLPANSGAYLLKKNFQYAIGDPIGKQKAITKAEKFIKETPLPF